VAQFAQALLLLCSLAGPCIELNGSKPSQGTLLSNINKATASCLKTPCLFMVNLHVFWLFAGNRRICCDFDDSAG